MSTNVKLSDINPLEHVTGDIAISQYNYESIMNGLVQWNMSKMDNVTIRVATRTEPYFVDYVIPTKYFYDRTYGGLASDKFLPAGGYAYVNREKLSVAKDDNMSIRVNVDDRGDTLWAIYADVTTYDEYDRTASNDGTVTLSVPSKYKHDYVEGLYVRGYDTSSHKFRLLATTGDIVAGSTSTYSLTKDIVVEVQSKTMAPTDWNQFVACFDGNVLYELKPKCVKPTVPGNITVASYNYEAIGYVYDENRNEPYSKGDIVYHEGNIYACVADSTIVPPAIRESGDTWTFNDDFWKECVPVRVNDDVVTGTVTYRTTAATDIAGIMLRNIGETESSENTRITLSSNVSYKGSETSQPTGVDIHPTCNYVNWPENDTFKWAAGSHYETDVDIPAGCKQDYSAVMVFNHYDPDVKYKNIVNYDGPDLDQGLCVMLPVTVTDDGVSHDPVDGCMFEFLFNIWPNHDYDGREVNDLIINKSQIYVYSVPDYDAYKQDFNISTVKPIAKFSMARLVNFYVASENIGVPDRPVCYKARFIYSASEGQWKTYDYYQLPDHVFMSPHGFVDPETQESAGFPLYQNPFSDYDLSAIHATPVYNQYQPDKNEN